MKIFKGIGNRFCFVVKNQDQKPVSLNQKVIKWDLVDRQDHTVALTKTLKIDTTHAGTAVLTLNENETINLTEKFYGYNLYTYDDKLNRIPLYTGLDYEGVGNAEVVGGDFLMHSPSTRITNFSNAAGVYTSDSAEAHPEINEVSSLQTVAVYGTGYSGTFKIQATMANDANPLDTFWFDVKAEGQESVINLSSFTGIKYFNFYGIFRLVRFVHTPSSGTIDQLLYRF